MNIGGFYPTSTSNGEGVRAVIFVSGCPHHCKGCHNPETWDENYGEPFNAEEILGEIKELSCIQGITLSGGEPLTVDHIRELLPIVRAVKHMGLSVWSYTGFRLEDLLARQDMYTKMILAEIDVLIDGKFEEDLTNHDLIFRGSSNQRIIDLNAFRLNKSIESSIKHIEPKLTGYEWKDYSRGGK